MAEAHGLALVVAVAVLTTGRQINQRARNCGRRTDSHSGGSHHGMVQFAHGKGAHQKVHFASVNLIAAGCGVASRWCDKCDFGRMLLLGGF